jgi:pimeloyl-ACP methyl ester carboxylesterase
MERRTILAAAAATPLALAAKAASSETERKTYVLVHGTWHGGWMWKPVRERLQDMGHRVFTPTCTGCGERKHLANPDVGLETHITDIANVIEYEELDRVILVGHSFAGITITGVADRMRERIRRIVFFDAIVPTKGRMSGVSRTADGQLPEYWKKRQAKFIDGYMMNFFDEYPTEMLVPKDDEANIAWLKRRITPHPAKQWSDELVLKNGGWEGLPRSFIHCVGQTFSQTSDAMVGPAKTDPGFQYLPVPFARNAMMTNPVEIAELLAKMT